MKKAKQYVLGIAVNSRALEAVLLREGPDGPVVVRQFRRQRNTLFSDQGAADGFSFDFDVAPPTAPADQDLGDDFGTLQFGGTPGAPDLFMGSEFGAAETGMPGMPGEMGQEDDAAPVLTFEHELTEILAECSEAGYEDPPIAFVNSSAEVTTVELRMTRKKESKRTENKEKEKGKDAEEARKKEAKKGFSLGKRTAPAEGGAPRRERLLELLRTQHEGAFDAERVAFVPMLKADEGGARFLALIPQTADAVVETIRVVREEKTRMPAVRLLDTEVTAYLGLTRAAEAMPSDAPPDEPFGHGEMGFDPITDGPRRTLMVRAGVEDTLVMFLQNGQLQHYETLRSITTFDAPETICSRVLLLQDEYGTGDVQRIFILGEEREETLVESFSLFFPDAQVGSLTPYLPREDASETEALPPTRTTVLAMVGALRLVKSEAFDGFFEDVNLLPKRLLKRRIKLPVTWHVMALYGLLFATVLFFVARYFQQAHEAEMYRFRLEAIAPNVTNDSAPVLQARIDSLRAVSDGYVRALDVIDSLLVGSDLWSRTMEKTSKEAASVSGVWIDAWRFKQAGQMLEIAGNATTRSHVVMLADRLDATIASLTFSEIREWPVFTFEMQVPLDINLPEAARYLRDRVQIEAQTAPSPPVTSTADGTAPPPPAETPPPTRSGS